jgi:hypothetical protein
MFMHDLVPVAFGHTERGHHGSVGRIQQVCDLRHSPRSGDLYTLSIVVALCHPTIWTMIVAIGTMFVGFYQLRLYLTPAP